MGSRVEAVRRRGRRHTCGVKDSFFHALRQGKAGILNGIVRLTRPVYRFAKITISRRTPMCHLFAHQPQRDYASQTRSLRIAGHSTSIRLEMAFWDTLEEIAAKE